MRPVVRGSVDLTKGTVKIDDKKKSGSHKFGNYKHAQSFLIENFGQYCSYCERLIVCAIAVEHKQPKSKSGDLKTQWTNFLLACTNCNSSKGDKNYTCIKGDKDSYIETYPGEFAIYPDGDTDTYSLYEYQSSGFVKPNGKPEEIQTARTIVTMAVVNLDNVVGAKERPELNNVWFSPTEDNQKTTKKSGKTVNQRGYAHCYTAPKLSSASLKASKLVKKLDKNNTAGPTHGKKKRVIAKNFNLISRTDATKNPDVKDWRALQRSEAWSLAERVRKKYDALKGTGTTGKAELYDEFTIELAKSTGFWSVWTTVFKESKAKDRPAVIPFLEKLVDRKNFPGTRLAKDFKPLLWTKADETTWANFLKKRVIKHAVRSPKKKKKTKDDEEVDDNVEMKEN